MIGIKRHIESARRAYGHIPNRSDLDCLCLSVERLDANLRHERVINQMHRRRALVLEAKLQDLGVDLRELNWEGLRL